MAGAGRKQKLAAWAWVFVAGLAALELLAHPLLLSRIPKDESWADASAFIRSQHEPDDRIIASPSWTDPIVRQLLGDLDTLRAAAPPDLGGFDRIWEIGPGRSTESGDPPALERHFGRVQVRMWPVDSPRVLYDFVEALPEAQVEQVAFGEVRPCPWLRARPSRGGLERGPMVPSERFVCDPRRPWLFVGATVLTDLELAPRRCIWQHPAGREPIRTVFRDVPLGPRLVVHAGIDYQVERTRSYAPVTLRVFVDDVSLGELVHRDGDGWSGMTLDTSRFTRPRGTVCIEAE